MNVIFCVIFLLSSLLLLLFRPEAFLPALLEGGQKAVTLSLSLAAVYAVWMGLMQVLSDSGLSQKLEQALRPLVRKLFRAPSPAAGEALAANLSANLLGLGGVATPYGVRAAALLSGENSRHNHAMLLVLNATSLQLLPTTVIALRETYGSAAAYDILLPSLLATLLSTLLGVLFVKLFVK